MIRIFSRCFPAISFSTSSDQFMILFCFKFRYKYLQSFFSILTKFEWNETNSISKQSDTSIHKSIQSFKKETKRNENDRVQMLQSFFFSLFLLLFNIGIFHVFIFLNSLTLCMCDRIELIEMKKKKQPTEKNYRIEEYKLHDLFQLQCGLRFPKYTKWKKKQKYCWILHILFSHAHCCRWKIEGKKIFSQNNMRI